MNTATIPSISRTVTVAAPVERAFAVFTGSMGSWWPADYHIGKAEFAEAVLETRVGGRWYERGVDGSECDWGVVRAWEPPHRLVVTWQINGQWEFDPDPEHASEIEVTFTAAGPEETVVVLEHRDLQRLVAGQDLYQGISGDGGWSLLLDRFAAAFDRV